MIGIVNFIEYHDSQGFFVELTWRDKVFHVEVESSGRAHLLGRDWDEWGETFVKVPLKEMVELGYHVAFKAEEYLGITVALGDDRLYVKRPMYGTPCVWDIEQRSSNRVYASQKQEDRMNIEIKYDGAYPNLCRGNLVVVIDGHKWLFPSYCLVSGGSVSFDENWSEHVSEGEWGIDEWPEGFPEEHKAAVLTAVNNEVPCGCCGGCV